MHLNFYISFPLCSGRAGRQGKRGGGLAVRSAFSSIPASSQAPHPVQPAREEMSTTALASDLSNFHMDVDTSQSVSKNDNRHFPLSSTPCVNGFGHFETGALSVIRPGRTTADDLCSTVAESGPEHCSELVESSPEGVQQMTKKHLSPIEEEGSSANGSSSSGSQFSVSMSATLPGLSTLAPVDEDKMDTTDGGIAGDRVAMTVFEKDPFDSSASSMWMQHSRARLEECPGYVNLTTTDMPEFSPNRAVSLGKLTSC